MNNLLGKNIGGNINNGSFMIGILRYCKINIPAMTKLEVLFNFLYMRSERSASEDMHYYILEYVFSSLDVENTSRIMVNHLGGHHIGDGIDGDRTWSMSRA